MDPERKKSLRNSLREAIGAKKIERSSKAARMNALDVTLKAIGLDKEKFIEDMEKVKKEQGNTFEMNIKTR
jgi:uncharacterized membrane protein